jgi:tetratricopeptide (TPR) repeat protein
MTTRLRSLDTNFVEIRLDVLSPDAALELLTALVGERRVGLTSPPAPLLVGEGSKKISVSPSSTSPSSLSPPFPAREGGLGGLGLSHALQLCEWLGYLPLGLELVGRYLAEDPDLSLAQMLERLKAQRLKNEAIDLDEQQLQNTFSTAQRGVRAAFELSWQELEPVTQHIAQFLSLFAPTVFLWEWVESETQLLNCSESDINTAKKQLYKRHLIGRVEEREGGYKIHPLIREFLQAKLAASEQADEFRQAFAAAFVEFAKEIPQSPTREFIQSVKEAIPHLEEVAKNLIDALSNDDLVWPFVGLGKFYEGQGLYALAEPWCKQCLEQSKRLLGQEHPHVATSLNNLAMLYDSQGRFAEAEPLYVQALELRKRLLGQEHPHVATSLNNLAGLYDSQGRFAEAEPLYVQALELSERVLGIAHPNTMTFRKNLELFRQQRRLLAPFNLVKRFTQFLKRAAKNLD